MQPLPDPNPTDPNSSTSPQHGMPSAPGGGDPTGKYRPFVHVPWNTRDLLWGVIWGLALLTGLTLLFSVGLGLAQRVTGIQLPPASGLITLLAELVLLLPVWWFGVRKYRLTWSSVGLRPFAPAHSLGLGCLFLILGFWFNLAWSLLLSLFGLRTQPNLLPIFGSGIGGLLLALFTGGLIAPIAEEVFFRGFVFAGMYRHLGLRRALVLSAILFALVHILPTSWPPIFVLGVLFAFLYEQTGSIWPAVVVHGAVNCISFLALYVLGR
jgi:membrane protease YdiL (CAAX protease family)